ncbi:hypothetical protein [Georgenia alba]|uniref:Pyrrolo-quinoline quinone repeat domain-containing protein n=1 Tax=Georgenia alba TaxID=2233858 RepID=A0ABW2QAR5_9MICO
MRASGVRRVVLVVVLAMVLVLGAVVGWSRWTVAAGGGSWTVAVAGARDVVDHDGDRLLVSTTRGFSVLDRTDGSTLAEHAVGTPVSSEGAVGFVDGGVLVRAEGRIGVMAADGSWAWRQESDATVVAVDPSRSRVVVLDWDTEMLLGLDSRTGEEVWAHPAIDVAPADGPRLGLLVATTRESGQTVVRTRDGTALSTLDPGSDGLGVGPGGVVAREGERCAHLVVVRPDGEVVTTRGTGVRRCAIAGVAAHYSYLVSDEAVLALEASTGHVRRLPVGVDDADAWSLVGQADRWLVLEEGSGAGVYDASTGEPTWSGSWQGDGGVLAVGTEGFVARDAPEPWDRTVGGAEGQALTFRGPQGAILGTFQPDGVGLTVARVLDRGQAVLVLADGEVAMLGESSEGA